MVLNESYIRFYMLRYACFTTKSRSVQDLLPSVLGMVIAIALSRAVVAGDDVDRSIAVNPVGVVRIINPRGDIEVFGWGRSEVRVEGELDDLAKSLTFEVNGDDTLIQIGLPNRNVNWGDGSDLEVFVPAICKLKIEGVSVDIEVEGVTGPIAIRTASGDVTLQGIGSRTQINTVSGDVEVSEGGGLLKVVTTSGDLNAELTASHVSVNTMSGDVELQLGEFEMLSMNSVSGSLEAEGGVKSRGRVAAESVSGDIELRLREPINTRIDVKTLSGDVDNDLTLDKPTKSLFNQLSLEATSGDGSAELRVRTVSGNVELESTDSE